MNPLVAAFARDALGRVDVLAAALTERVRTREPELADAAVTEEDTRVAVTRLLTAVLRSGAEGVPLDTSAARGLGRRRAAQGVSSAAVLRALALGCRFLWDELLAQPDADDSGARAVLLNHVDLLWCALDEFSAQFRLGYEESAHERRPRAEARRTAFLDALFTGRPDGLSALRTEAAALGLPEQGRFHAVVARGMDAVERNVWSVHAARLGVVARWREYPAETVGVFGLSRPGELPSPPDPRCRVGLSPPYADLAQTAAAVRRARTAVAALPPGGTGLSSYGENPTACLVAGSPADAADLALLLLGPVFDLPAADVSALLATLAAWFAAAGSLAEAAAMLKCHRNTVRYRLGRIRKVTGRSMTDPRSVGDFHVAVRSLIQQGLVAPPPG